jgi:hypothetical protein
VKWSEIEFMRKSFLILCILVLLTVAVPAAAAGNAPWKVNVSVSGQAFPNPFRAIGRWLHLVRPKTPICTVPDVTDLSLSTYEIPVDSPKTIDVLTTGFDPEGDTLIYRYSISAGKIVGTGPRVVWDLTGLEPGTYTITAGVDDGCGVCGHTMTKNIVIIERKN